MRQKGNFIMHALFNPLIILILYVLVVCLDIVVGLTPGVRRLVYGILGLLALIYLIIALLLH